MFCHWALTVLYRALRCQMVPYGAEWCQTVPNSAKWWQTVLNGAKWCQMLQNSEMVPNGSKIILELITLFSHFFTSF